MVYSKFSDDFTGKHKKVLLFVVEKAGKFAMNWTFEK